MENVVQQCFIESGQEEPKKRNRAITSKDLEGLLIEQNYRCALSGVMLTPKNTSCDHVVALEKGGEHRIENLQLVDKTVNRMKNTMSQEDFVSWCRRVSQNME
jgi:5-methylcytosine-specific restriction endonuclease McrA